jgi:hypothetical protein
VGRFLSTDPLQKTYPWYTPYQFAGNKPIFAVDIDGLEEASANSATWKQKLGFAFFGVTQMLTAGANYLIKKENVSTTGGYKGPLADAGQRVVTSVGSTLNGGLHAVTAGAWPLDPSATLGFDPSLNPGASNLGQAGGTVTSIGFGGTPGASLELAPTANGPSLLQSLNQALHIPLTVYSNTSGTDNNATDDQGAAETKSAQLKINSQNGATSEDIVRGRLQNQLGDNEAILTKPRIYIGDGSSGKYATPDFAIYNTKTGQISRIVDAKNGGATLSRAQQQLNEYGGIFRGSSRATDAKPQSVKPGMIQVERTNVSQQ